jgi:ABC-2 type transport system permease protein
MLFRYAIRLGRWGILGFGALSFALTLLQAAGFYQVAGHTLAERAAFGRSMAQLAAQFTILIPPPTQLWTVGGYVQWRAYGFFAILFAIWALASGTGAARGDEERGLVEAVLARGVSRADVVLARFGAFAAGSLLAASAAALGFIAGVDRTQDSIDLGALGAVTILLVGLALSCYALTLLVCQLVAARIATAAAGVVLLTLFLVNSLGRTFDWLGHWRWLSPFYYYEQSRPLPPAGFFDVRATEVLFGIAVVAGLGAVVAFSYRDLGAPLIRLPAAARPATFEPSRSVVWRIPVVRGLYERRVGLVAWTIGVSALGALFVVLTKSIIQPLLGIAQLAPYFNSIIRGDIYPSFLGFIWFGFAELLVAGYAITQVARWSAEDTDGRLEMTLSNPVSRGMVIVERAIVLALGTLLIAGVSGLVVGIESHAQSIDVNIGRLVGASLLLVPFAMFFAGVGAPLASRIPRATVGLLAGFAIGSYFVTQVGPIFKWPAWTQDLSAFHLFGQPLSGGVDGGGLAIMLAVSLGGLVVSGLLMERRDIGA